MPPKTHTHKTHEHECKRQVSALLSWYGMTHRYGSMISQATTRCNKYGHTVHWDVVDIVMLWLILSFHGLLITASPDYIISYYIILYYIIIVHCYYYYYYHLRLASFARASDLWALAAGPGWQLHGMCAYIYIYVYMYVCMYAYIYIYSVCIYIYIYIYAYIPICIHVHVFIHMYLYMIYIYTHTHTES